MQRWKFFIPAFAFLALAILLWRGLYLDPQELPSMLIDKPMPGFELTTVEGQQVSNADLPDEVQGWSPDGNHNRSEDIHAAWLSEQDAHDDSSGMKDDPRQTVSTAAE